MRTFRRSTRKCTVLDTPAPSTENSMAGEREGGRGKGKKAWHENVAVAAAAAVGSTAADAAHGAARAAGDDCAALREVGSPRLVASSDPVWRHSRRDKEDERQEGHEHDEAAPAFGDAVAAEAEVRQHGRKRLHLL